MKERMEKKEGRLNNSWELLLLHAMMVSKGKRIDDCKSKFTSSSTKIDTVLLCSLFIPSCFENLETF